MNINILIDYLFISIAASMTINSILRNYALKYTLLIDIPDRSRRFHKRPTPLTGGIGIFIALLISGLWLCNASVTFDWILFWVYV